MIRTPWTPVLLALCLAASPMQAVAQEGAGNAALRRAVALAKQKIYPALVNISVLSRTFSGGRSVRQMSSGSGTVVSSDGFVLTNYHVARDAIRLVCTLTTGEQIPADLVGEDPMTDLAVIKLRMKEREAGAKPLRYASFGDSDALEVGQPVLAVGNPLSLSSSMSLGIVSNPHRVFTSGLGTEIQNFDFGGGNKTGMFTVWIQHDALILPGNSGGPLVNLKGEIVGVNTRGGTGYGFASPSKLAQKVFERVVRDGRVIRGWIGASFIPVSKLGRKKGALVGSIAKGSPAEKGGLKAGDIVLRIGKGEANARFFEQVPALYNRIADVKPGEDIEISIQRGPDHKVLTVKAGAMADFVGAQSEFPVYGITLQRITEPMARARRYPSKHGLVVTGVRAGMPFEVAKPGVVPGDVILEVAGKKLDKLSDFSAALGKSKLDEIPIVFRRGRQLLVTLVKNKKDEKRKSGGELAKAWMGIRTQVMTPDVAKALGLKGQKGFRVTEVFPFTKAAEAGVKQGDILVGFDGDVLDAWRSQDARDLRNAIEELAIGEDVELDVLRNGKRKKLKVELEESPSSSMDAKKGRSKTFEFHVRELTFMDRVARDLSKDQGGLIVTEVSNGGWASMAGLRRGMLVLRVDGKEVPNVRSFEAVLKDVVAKKKKVVPVFVRTGARTSFVFIEPDWSGSSEGAKGQTQKKS